MLLTVDRMRTGTNENVDIFLKYGLTTNPMANLNGIIQNGNIHTKIMKLTVFLYAEKRNFSCYCACGFQMRTIIALQIHRNDI